MIWQPTAFPLPASGLPLPASRLLVPESLYGIEPGGAGGGKDPEQDTCERTRCERSEHRRERGRSRHGRERRLDPERHENAEDEPDRRADAGESRRFNQELPENGALGCSECL